MLNRTPAPRPRNRRCLRSLLWLSIFVLGIGQANAQPEVYNLAPESLLAQGEPLGSKQQPPLAELDQVLRATQAKFEELSGAIAALAADSEVHNEIRTLKQENECLVVQLQQESARHTELESSNELAAARMAELSKAVDAAARLPASGPNPSPQGGHPHRSQENRIPHLLAEPALPHRPSTSSDGP